MKKWIAVFLAIFMLLSLTACSNADRPTIKFEYKYDSDKRPIEAKRYTLTGEEYVLTLRLEFDYNADGEFSEWRIYDEKLDVPMLVQRNVYAYNAEKKLQSVELYDQDGDRFCQAAYSYYENGAIKSKEALFSKLVITECWSQEMTETGEMENREYYVYNLPSYYDQDRINFGDTGVVIFGGDGLLGKVTEKDASATYTKRVDYYENGIEKTVAEYRSGGLFCRTEYMENENFKDSLISDDMFIMGGAGIGYKENGDGTYSTVGNVGTKVYTYGPGETLIQYMVCETNGDQLMEDYFSNGKIKSRYRYANISFTGLEVLSPVEGEEYYESGAVKTRYAASYDDSGEYVDLVSTEYYEGGQVKSEKRFDPQTKNFVVKEYDENGKVVSETVYDKNGNIVS